MTKTAPARTEFASAVNQIAHERGLDPNVVLETIKQAVLAAFKKDNPGIVKEDHYYDVELDPNSGEAKIISQEGVVTETDGVVVVEPKKGATKVDVTPPGFGRIAAQTAKHVILQKIREAEKSNIVADFQKRAGTLISGVIIRFVGPDIMVDIGKTEAVFPSTEQIHSENYHVNLRLTFLIKGIRDGLRGKEVVVSRADAGLIRELFRREVPEVNSGAVEIKGIARDPGSRTKIAVYSHQTGVDPVGSCVGQKGVRVQTVISEVNGEKIDIVQYSDDPVKFVTAALSPASNLRVVINSKKQIAEVMAPADQLSLVIGREGQNAKLAGKLTGYHIDVKELAGPTAEAQGTSEEKEDVSATNQPQITNDQ